MCNCCLHLRAKIVTISGQSVYAVLLFNDHDFANHVTKLAGPRQAFFCACNLVSLTFSVWTRSQTTRKSEVHFDLVT